MPRTIAAVNETAQMTCDMCGGCFITPVDNP